MTTWDEPNYPGPDYIEPDTDTCPYHGEQEIKGYGSTGGPDPYMVTGLKCGCDVICMGPGEPNEVIS